MDTHKSTISVALTEGGRHGKVRFVGASRLDSVGKMIDRFATKHARLAFCHEARPCGYGLHRQYPVRT
jgi:transposase